jgi:hypothetical protein
MKSLYLIPALCMGLLSLQSVRAEQEIQEPVIRRTSDVRPVVVEQAPQVTQVSQPVQERIVVQQVERDPALGSPLPEGKVYETKDGWKFKDDELVFKTPNQNADGNRYLIWKDYHWIVNDSQITVIDPAPFGTTITSARHGLDKKGRRMDDEKTMDSLKDQAGDIRRAREPYPAYSPVDIGIGFGFGFGGYYGPSHYHGPRYYRPAPRYRYR